MLKLMRFTLVPFGVLLLAVSACGGDDDSGGAATATVSPAETDDTSGDTSTSTKTTAVSADLEEYFAALEQIGLTTDTKLEQISSDMQNATFDTDAEEIAATQAGLQESGETVEKALLDLSDLDPPTDVEDAHNEFVQKLQAVLPLWANFLADLDDVSTSAELNDLADSYNADITNADSEFDDACIALQNIADDANIDVDLRCSD